MAVSRETTVSIAEALFNQAEALAQHLTISRNRLFEIAIEQFVSTYTDQMALNKPAASAQDAKTVPQNDEGQLAINQGDVYWVQLADTGEAQPGIPHPHVVIQDNLFNHSRVDTVITCALTTNVKRANAPGNVLLDVGEANLPKQSIVEISKVSTVKKAQLGDYIGSLSKRRIDQILAGMRFLQASFFR